MRCSYSRVYYRIIVNSPTEIKEVNLNNSICSNNLCSYSTILANSPAGYNVTIQAGNDVGLSSPVSVEVRGAKQMCVSTSDMNQLSGK